MENWSYSSAFTLSAQTPLAFAFMRRYQANLLNEPFESDYELILASKFQSDPIERIFSPYRHKCGCEFLVGLREVEVINSKRILSWKALIKVDINF